MSLGVLDSGDDATRVTFEVTKDKVRTWQEMRRNGEARWAEHDVFAAKPVSEFIGPGLEGHDLEVRFDAALGLVPDDELKKLRTVRDAGVVLQFTVGGKLIGDYTLRSIDEDHKRHGRQGELVLVVVRLNLKEYA